MDRFERLYSQGVLDVMEIWLDTVTGVQYLYHRSGNSGGLTPLLGPDGKPLAGAPLNDDKRSGERYEPFP